MRSYTITDGASGTAGECAAINYNWFGGAESPPTFFSVQLDRSFGFLVRMECKEPNPKAVYHDHDKPVFEDSCMEVFMDFYPEKNIGYLNIEVNANGAMLCMFGKTRVGRQTVRGRYTDVPRVTVKKQDDRWIATVIIPFPLIEALYGTSEMRPGHRMRGNFYKCGDKTDSPHWGSWNSLGDNPVDFHQPETFGELILSA